MRRSLTFVAAICATVLTLTGVSAAQADTGTPDPTTGNYKASYDYAQLSKCDTSANNTANGLHLQTDHTLDGKDETVNMRPVQNVHYVPVIIVHGWTGDRSAWGSAANMVANADDVRLDTSIDEDTSIVGQLKKLHGVAVYTFDYHSYSTLWVDNPHIYKDLRNAINCLATTLKSPVIGVAHSMGGLAFRLAMDDPTTAKNVSNIYTLDTPNTGARLGGGKANFFADLLLNISCYNEDLAVQAACYANAQGTTAYAQLLTNSPGINQLAKTASWDKIRTLNPALKVYSYTGDMIEKQLHTNIFGYANTVEDISIGDGIVSTASAEWQSNDSERVTCEQTLKYKSSTVYDFYDARTGALIVPKTIGTIFGYGQGGVTCEHGNMPNSERVKSDLFSNLEGVVYPNGLDYYRDLSFAAWVIKPGQMGPLKLGMTTATVSQLTGDPYRSENLSGDPLTYTIYGGYGDQAGLSMGVTKNNVVTTLYSYPDLGSFTNDIAKWQPAMPVTNKSIRVGDPQAKVVAAYGLSLKRDKDRLDKFSYGSTGSGANQMTFVFYKNRLASLQVGPGARIEPAYAFLDEQGF